MKSLHKFRHGLDTVLSWVCALLFAAMVVVGTYQIVTRYFLDMGQSAVRSFLCSAK